MLDAWRTVFSYRPLKPSPLSALKQLTNLHIPCTLSSTTYLFVQMSMFLQNDEFNNKNDHSLNEKHIECYAAA